MTDWQGDVDAIVDPGCPELVAQAEQTWEHIYRARSLNNGTTLTNQWWMLLWRQSPQHGGRHNDETK